VSRAERIYIVDHDEWTGPLLARALQEKGFTTELFTEARTAFARACAAVPDCIVSATELPDVDGLWLARRIRTEPGMVSKTPFLFVGPEGNTDPDLRAQALSVGGDVFLARPFTNDELVAQVNALVAFLRRFGARPSLAPPSLGISSAALRGDLSLFPLASILMMFELERRSGTVDVIAASGSRALMIVNEGLFATTEIGGVAKPAVEVLREVLSWRAGTFAFTPRDATHLPAPRASVGALVLEAMRLEDELNQMPPSARSAPPAKKSSDAPPISAQPYSSFPPLELPPVPAVAPIPNLSKPPPLPARVSGTTKK